MRRADRHRRPGDGPRRGEEPPVRRGGDGRRRVPADRAGPRRRRFHADAAQAARGPRVRGHRRVRRGGGELVRDHAGAGRVAGVRRAGAAARRPRCGTARTRTRRPRSTSTRPRRPGWPRPSSCTARRCPTTTTSTRTPPGARANDFTEPCVAIIKHANPCGIAVGADVAEAHRKAHACDPVSAFGGVIAVNRQVTAELAKQVAEIFTEVIVAPSLRATARSRCCARRRTCGCCVAPAWSPPPAEFGRSAAACWCRWRTGSTPPATTRRTGRWPPARRRPPSELADLAFAWRAIRSVKTNAILLAARRRHRRRRHGPGQPGRLGAARGEPGRRRTGPGAAWPRPTRSSRSRTAWRC